MLRIKPSTPLVCLVVLMVTTLSATAMAEKPDESLDILINAQQSTPAPETYSAKPKFSVTPAGQGPRAPRSYSPRAPRPIVKVKPPAYCPPGRYGIPCILPAPRYRQWEMSMQVLFARTRGSIEWPRRNNNSFYYYNQGDEADLNGDLKLPEHEALVTFSARYQFRPTWGIRYVLMSEELSGSGQSERNFYFGTRQISSNEDLNPQWNHIYQRVELVYDAIRSCKGALSVFGGWVHVDDKITVNCSFCGNYTTEFSQHGDLAIAGVEFQRCLKTAPNGGTFSSHCKAAFMFMDDSEGWDLEAALKYSIPVNCGRWGYVKSGYRFIDLKKSNNQYVFDHAMEGGFLEFGFVF